MKKVTYTNELRVNDNLPEGVTIIPIDGDDVPVLNTKSGQLPLQEGDVIIYPHGKAPYVESPNVSEL